MKSTKHEIRSTKQYVNSDTKNSRLFWSFEFITFEIVSDFDIRISNLPL